MTIDYELGFVESFPSPLADVKADETQLGADARQHLSEMKSINGPGVAEYGGDEPWTHEWIGTFRPNQIPDVRVSEDADFEERAEYAIDSLLTFFDNSCTPHNSEVDDFEWTVRVSTDSAPPLPDDVYSIQIVWTPKE